MRRGQLSRRLAVSSHDPASLLRRLLAGLLSVSVVVGLVLTAIPTGAPAALATLHEGARTVAPASSVAAAVGHRPAGHAICSDGSCTSARRPVAVEPAGWDFAPLFASGLPPQIMLKRSVLHSGGRRPPVSLQALSISRT